MSVTKTAQESREAERLKRRQAVEEAVQNIVDDRKPWDDRVDFQASKLARYHEDVTSNWVGYYLPSIIEDQSVPGVKVGYLTKRNNADVYTAETDES